MPRKEFNNPTERIARMLEEIDELEHKYIEARDLLASHLPEIFEQLSPEPHLENIAAERTRHQLTYRRVQWGRDAMRELRTRGHSFVEPTIKKNKSTIPGATRISHKPHKLPDWRGTQGISADIERAIDRDVEKFVASGIKTWQPNSKCPATQGPCPMESEENCICLHPELR